MGGIVALGGALSWALYTLLGKASVHRWGGVVATTWAICLGSVVMCAIVVGRGTEIVLPGVALWLVLYVALIPTACGFVWWYAALEHVPANLIGPLQYIAPVFGILLGWVLLKEPIESSFAVGAALVFVGVWVATRCETSPN
ncbi:MAG: DMT family transporter [Candidatus Zipacnadales bacterium]